MTCYTLFFTAGNIGSHSSHVQNVYVTAPGKFMIEAGFICTMKSHSSQVKKCMFFIAKSHICHRFLLSLFDIYVVDIHVCVYSSYKESLIMLMYKNWLCCCYFCCYCCYCCRCCCGCCKNMVNRFCIRRSFQNISCCCLFVCLFVFFLFVSVTLKLLLLVFVVWRHIISTLQLALI